MADASLPSLNGLGDTIIAGAILISAACSIVAAFIAVAQNRRISRKRTAYDLALLFLQADIQACEDRLIDLADKNDWRPVLEPQPEERIVKQEVTQFLNHLELMSVAIRQGVVDEGVLKAVIGDKLVKRYTEARPLIDMIRNKEQDEEFFEHLEFIANSWKKNPRS